MSIALSDFSILIKCDLESTQIFAIRNIYFIHLLVGTSDPLLFTYKT